MRGAPAAGLCARVCDFVRVVSVAKSRFPRLSGETDGPQTNVPGSSGTSTAFSVSSSIAMTSSAR